MKSHRTHRSRVSGAGTLLPAATLAALAAFGLHTTASAAAPSGRAGDIERGKYLAAAGDCQACHTAVNGQPFAGGLSMDTPYGPISTPNITPDKRTGIGNWTDDEFYRALHDGIGHEGEYLYPVMPFPWYTTVSRDDVMAIKAYLFSLAPIDRPRDASHLAFPYSVRTSLAAWRAVFFTAGTFQKDPSKSDEVNRGAYLVNGLTHCGECHNSRLLAGASKTFQKPLQGGEIDGWYAPNITSDVGEGIGGWTNEQLVTFLKSGAAPGKGIALGPMAQTVHSLSQLSDPDLRAIAAYLKSTPAASVAEHKQPLYQGAEARGAPAYLNYCASCHGVDGKGLAGSVPALDGNGAVTAKGPQNVIQVVLGGLEARVNAGPMPAIGAGMTDQEIADAANYARQLGGNHAPPSAEPGLVAQLRATTNTLLNGAPEQPCPGVPPPAIRKALADPRSGIEARLAHIDDANMYGETAGLLAALKSVSGKLAAPDVVNGLTAAYCSIVRGDPTLAAPAKALRLGHFSEMVYMQQRGPQVGTR